MMVTTQDVAKALSRFHTTFRQRTYRGGQKVLFMFVKNATWKDLESVLGWGVKSTDLLPGHLIIQEVERLVPGAFATSGGLGDMTFRLPEYIQYAPTSYRARRTPKFLERLHRFDITIRSQDDSIRRHIQKDRGDREPLESLRRAFAALSQLLRHGDRDFTIRVTNRGTKKIVIQTPVVGVSEQTN